MIAVRSLVLFACVLLTGCSYYEEQQHLAAANEYLSSRNDISPEFREAIKKGLVVVGMAPDEASVAGGANVFEIDRDRKVWPKEETDPWRILRAQRLHPDDSKINLHFQNRTQYGTSDRVQFTVSFVHGRAVTIQRGWHFDTPQQTVRP